MRNIIKTKTNLLAALKNLSKTSKIRYYYHEPIARTQTSVNNANKMEQIFPKYFNIVSEDIVVKNPDLNDKNMFGMTLFHKLCLSHSSITVAVIKESFEMDADPNTKSVSGSTPFMELCKNPNVEYEVIREFFKRNADPNLIDEDGMSAFHHYCSTCCPDPKIIKEFLDNGADPNLLNNEGSTPFNLISEIKGIHPKIIKLFVDHGANVHLQDQYERSPFKSLINNFGREQLGRILQHSAVLNL